MQREGEQGPDDHADADRRRTQRTAAAAESRWPRAHAIRPGHRGTHLRARAWAGIRRHWLGVRIRHATLVRKGRAIRSASATGRADRIAIAVAPCGRRSGRGGRSSGGLGFAYIAALEATWPRRRPRESTARVQARTSRGRCTSASTARCGRELGQEGHEPQAGDRDWSLRGPPRGRKGPEEEQVAAAPPARSARRPPP